VPIRDYVWAYTGRHLLYVQDAGGDENFHIFRVDLGDGKTTDLTPFAGARAELVKRSPTQPSTIMVAINDRDPKVHDLYKLDRRRGLRGERQGAVRARQPRPRHRRAGLDRPRQPEADRAGGGRARRRW